MIMVGTAIDSYTPLCMPGEGAALRLACAAGCGVKELCEHKASVCDLDATLWVDLARETAHTRRYAEPSKGCAYPP